MAKKKPKKKEMKSEKFMSTASSVIIIGCIAIISGGMLVMERPVKSDTENRMLATMPEWSFESYLDGTFTSGVSEFYNDTVPLRSVFKNWNTQLSSLMGIQVDDVTFHGNVSMIGKEDNQGESQTEETTENTDMMAVTDVTEVSEESGTAETDITAETTETEISTEESSETTTSDDYWEEDENDVDNGKVKNGIIIYKNRGIMLYGSWESTLDSYVAAVNAYKAELGDSVNVYSMVVPTAASYYLPSKYADYSEDQFADLQYMRERYQGVIDVDISAVMDNHKNEDIYLRTDHHWSPLGAYYATEKFASVAGVPFADLSTYTPVSEDGYVGTIYTFTQDSKILNYPETFTYYMPDNQYTTTYSNTYNQNSYESSLFIDMPISSKYVTFLGGDDKITHIHTDAANGRRICIFKDSYGNAEIPFLTHSFEDIYVVDIRYFNINAINFIRENNVTDVLFTFNIFTAATPSHVKKIDNIRVQ